MSSMMLDLQPGLLAEPLTGRRWTPAETARRVAARVAAYQASGFGRGDRAFIHFGNCNEFFVELLAVWQAGGCAIPIDTRFTPFEIETLAAWAHPRLSVWNGEPEAASLAALTRLGVDTMNVAAADASRPSTPVYPPGARLDDVALILFTSGTTGQPKGVVHTHRSLRARWISLRDHLGLESYRRTLCLLPTHFGHGLICNCLFPWLSGCELHILPPFKPDIVAQLGTLLAITRCKYMSAAPIPDQ
jgi:acyl-CoA synthetase (AMP-forming)/AMP-acid ligase II